MNMHKMTAENLFLWESHPHFSSKISRVCVCEKPEKVGWPLLQLKEENVKITTKVSCMFFLISLPNILSHVS